jgi:hypothetical protein
MTIKYLLDFIQNDFSAEGIKLENIVVVARVLQTELKK